MVPFFFFFNDTATTEIYTLSLHDALPISFRSARSVCLGPLESEDACWGGRGSWPGSGRRSDRKSTRLNSSHLVISYAVFCLKKKKSNPSLSTLLDSHMTSTCGQGDRHATA